MKWLKELVILSLLLVVLVVVLVNPVQSATLSSGFATIKDWDKTHERFDFLSGSVVKKGGDFFIADRGDESIIHVFNAPGIIDMGCTPLDDILIAPKKGYQDCAKPIVGHSYVIRSHGKYGKIQIYSIKSPPSVPITEYYFEWVFQPNGSRDFGKSTLSNYSTEASCVNVPLTVDAWIQEPHRQGLYLSTSNGLLVKGGPWTNGRLVNNKSDGNYLLSKQSFDFTKGGDVYMAFVAHGNGYMSIYAPGLIEITDTVYIHTGNKTTNIKIPWLTTYHSWMGSIVIPDDETLFVHLHIDSNRIYHWTVCENNYDDQGGKIIVQYNGIISKEHWQNFKNAKVPIYFLDNHAGENAYMLIKDVKVCVNEKCEELLEFNWSWSDPNTNDYFLIQRNKFYLKVNPYQNIWWCDRGTAPLLTTEIPKANKWSAEVKLNLTKREPSTHVGLVIWDGREQNPVHALYVGLYDVDRVRVEGSYSGTCTGWPDALKNIENNTGTFDDIYKQKMIFLKIEKDEQSYAFCYRSSNFEKWKMLGQINTTDNFTRIGFIGKSWGGYGVEANFTNFNIVVDNFVLVATKKIGINGGEITTRNIEIIIPEGALNSTHVIRLYERKPYSYESCTISRVFKIEGFPIFYSKPITLKLKLREGYEKDRKIRLKIGYDGFVYDCKGTCEIHDFFKGNISNGYFVVQLPRSIESEEIHGMSFSMIKTSPVVEEHIRKPLLGIYLGLSKDTYEGYGYSMSSVVKYIKNIIYSIKAVFFSSTQQKTYVTKDGHFKIEYPSNIPEEKIKKIGNYLENAYKKFLSLGFSYNKRTSWPMRVEVKDLGKDAYGYYTNSIRGNNFGYIQINSKKIDDLKEMKTTIGHEFFHFVQSLYDPRCSYSKAKFFSTHAWLDEACAVWSEALFSDDPNYVSPVVEEHIRKPLLGIYQGLSKDTYEGYGYSMSAVIKYLVKKKGRGVVLDLYKQIESGKDSVEAFLNVAGPPEEWYSDFLKEYIKNSPAAFVSEIVGITEENKNKEQIFSYFYPDLSARVYRINFETKAFNDEDSITFSIEGPGKVMVLKVKNNKEAEWIGPSARITLNNLKSLINSGYRLYVVVVNDLCSPPYDKVKIALKIKMKLTEKEKNVEVRVENLTIKKTNKDFVVKGTVIGTNLNPEGQICEFDDVYIVADIKENSSSKYPELPEFYSIGWGCDVKNGKCLTKEEAEGVGITKHIISHFSLRPRWVWERYGGLEKWRERAPSTVKMNFSGTIPLEYEGKMVRIRAKLVHCWGGPYAYWPAISYHHYIAYEGRLTGDINITAPLAP